MEELMGQLRLLQKQDLELERAKKRLREVREQAIKAVLTAIGLVLSAVLFGLAIVYLDLDTPICTYHLLLLSPFPFMCWVQGVQGKEWEKFKKDMEYPG